jgi:hypothetical protein
MTNETSPFGVFSNCVVDVEVVESVYQYTGTAAPCPLVFAAVVVPDCGVVPGGTVPDGTVPGGTVPDGTVPDGTVLDGTVLDGVVRDAVVLDGTVLDGTVLDGVVLDGVGCDEGPLVAGSGLAGTDRCKSEGVADANGRDENHPPVTAATATATTTAAATAAVTSPRGTDRSVRRIPVASSTDGAVWLAPDVPS